MQVKTISVKKQVYDFSKDLDKQVQTKILLIDKKDVNMNRFRIK